MHHGKSTGLVTPKGKPWIVLKPGLCASVGLRILAGEWEIYMVNPRGGFLFVGTRSLGMGCAVNPRECVLV